MSSEMIYIANEAIAIAMICFTHEIGIFDLASSRYSGKAVEHQRISQALWNFPITLVQPYLRQPQGQCRYSDGSGQGA